MNLTGAVSATLSFHARWEVEPRFDYVEVQASANGGSSWTALCGKYTKPGNAYQDNLKPVYDGFMFPWVREEIDLDNYVNSNLLLRFMLKADNGSEYDGFFFDDLKVEAILSTSAVSETGNELQFSVFPNPSSGEFTIYGLQPGVALSVNDVYGKNVLNRNVDQKKETVRLNEAGGVYFIKVTDGNGNFGVKKIVLQ